MSSATERVAWDRVPVIISFSEQSAFVETYGFTGSQGLVWLEAQHFVPRDRPSNTLFIVMHPSSMLQLLPLPGALASAGLHVLCANSRYAKNDSALIMEKVAYDLGQYVRWAREQGYEKVVLVGWSGGGGLALFYQGQAENPSITHTPAGDPYNLVAADLSPADGVVLIAAHLSRAETITEFLDPSILDELDPDKRDMELDIYDPDCPNKPPYSAGFIARFRAAQRDRSDRITDHALEMLDALKRRGGHEAERAFIVHRTWCDVRWMDLSIDPNGRKPFVTLMGDPRVANSAPAGLARYSSLRSWLSQWSISRSQANGSDSAPRIRKTPVLQIDNGADDGVPATHNPRIHELLGTSDKEFRRIETANHYYVKQPEELAECVALVTDWARRKTFIA